MTTHSVVRIAVKGVIVGAGALVGAVVVTAWTGPTGTAPNSNVSAPINVGTASQTKNGALGVNSLAVYGNASVSGSISTDEGVIRDAGGGWVRTYGATGWYNQTYGGGWYMSDTTWLRSYGSKALYTGTGIIRSDGGVQVGSSGSAFNVASNGNTSIAGSLTVNDKITLNGFMDVNGYVDVYGTMSAYNLGVRDDFYFLSPPSGNGNHVCWNPSSDRIRQQSAACSVSDARLKEHIKPLQRGLAEVLKLNPVTFEWKDKEVMGGGEKLGLIAQEVKEIFPELITGTGTGVDGDWYGVDYDALAAPMIKAIQELKAENDELRAELTELRALVESK
jgi:hypothetical protein